MKKLYCLRDERAEMWYPPFPAANDQDASRSFGGLLRQRDTLPAQHPADFALYLVGQFDEGLSGNPIELFVGEPKLLWTGSALLRFYQDLAQAEVEVS